MVACRPAAAAALQLDPWGAGQGQPRAGAAAAAARASTVSPPGPAAPRRPRGPRYQDSTGAMRGPGERCTPPPMAQQQRMLLSLSRGTQGGGAGSLSAAPRPSAATTAGPWAWVGKAGEAEGQPAAARTSARRLHSLALRPGAPAHLGAWPAPQYLRAFSCTFCFSFVSFVRGRGLYCSPCTPGGPLPFPRLTSFHWFSHGTDSLLTRLWQLLR
jgi:hypothetical protein